MQTIKNWVSNQLLLLYAIDRVDELTVTRVHKTAFLSQRNSYENQKSTYNYQFTKMRQGPWSNELSRDLKELSNSNYLLEHKLSRRDDIIYTVERQGYKLLDDFSEIIKRNRVHLKIVDKQVDKVKRMKYESLLAYIHSLKNPASPHQTIHNTPQNKYLLTRELKPSEYEELQITREEIATLEVLLSPKYLEAIQEGDNSAKEELVSYNFE